MKTRLLILTCIALAYLSTGFADCLTEVDQTKVKAAIANLNASYGDVPSLINCNKPGKGDERVCSNPTLVLMAELDSKAAVYAYENATGTETDHKKPDKQWITELRRANKTPLGLCEAFKSHTTDSLGDTPY